MFSPLPPSRVAMARLQLPLPEFLCPDRLSCGAFRLPHEDGADKSGRGVAETDDADAVRWREMENAARLALLLCRAVVRSPDLSLARLANFMVDFEERDSTAVGEGGEGAGVALLLGVDDFAPTAVDLVAGPPQQIIKQATPLKHLGCLLYSVFGGGAAPRRQPDIAR